MLLVEFPILYQMGEASPHPCALSQRMGKARRSAISLAGASSATPINQPVVPNVQIDASECLTGFSQFIPRLRSIPIPESSAMAATGEPKVMPGLFFATLRDVVIGLEPLAFLYHLFEGLRGDAGRAKP